MSRPSMRGSRRSRLGVGMALLFLIGLSLPIVVSGCGGSDSSSPGTMAPTTMSGASHSTTEDTADPSTEGLRGHDMDLSTVEMTAAWDARPDYVASAEAAVREAYAFSLQQASALTWMPCYCGCVGMEHRSNLDCFARPRAKGEPVVFDEHASFCGICVETALLTKRMLAGGSSLAQVRAAVDAEFGAGGAPGTLTDLPPI